MHLIPIRQDLYLWSIGQQDSKKANCFKAEATSTMEAFDGHKVHFIHPW